MAKFDFHDKTLLLQGNLSFFGCLARPSLQATWTIFNPEKSAAMEYQIYSLE